MLEGAECNMLCAGGSRSAFGGLRTGFSLAGLGTLCLAGWLSRQFSCALVKRTGKSVVGDALWLHLRRAAQKDFEVCWRKMISLEGANKDA